MPFEAVARNPVYLQVAEQIREAILTGDLLPGEALPSERELAESFGVSRTSVREGLRALEAQGLITTGTGPASRPAVSSEMGTHARDTIVNLIRLHQIGVGDLVDVRCALEAAGLQAAARRSESEGLDEARQALADQRSGDVDIDTFREADLRFHLALARASGNEAIYLLMLALREAVTRYLLDILQRAPDMRAALRRLAQEHADILVAVEAGDGDRAARLVTRHIKDFYQDATAHQQLGRDGRRARGRAKLGR